MWHRARSLIGSRLRSLLHAAGQPRTLASRPPRSEPALEPLEPRALLAAFAWSGLGDGTSWNDAGNWAGSVEGVPTFNDTVLIAQPAAISIGGGAAAALSLTITAPVSLAAGSISVAQDVQWSGGAGSLLADLTAGGAFSFNPASSSDPFSLSGSLQSAGVFLSGPLTVAGNSSIISTGPVQFDSTIDGLSAGLSVVGTTLALKTVNLGSFNATGSAIAIAGDQTAASELQYTGDLVVAGSTTLAAPSVTINGATDAADGFASLTVQGTTSVTVGSIGVVLPFASVTLTGPSIDAKFIFASDAISLSTTTAALDGTLNAGGPLSITGDISTASDVSLVSLNSSVTANGIAAGQLFVQAATQASLGTISASLVTISATSILVGSITATSNIALTANDTELSGGTLDAASVGVYGSVRVTGSTNVRASGSVTFFHAVDGPASLDIAAGVNANNLGPVGQTTPLASLRVAAGSVGVGSVSTIGFQDYSGAVLLVGSAYEALSGPISVSGSTNFGLDATVVQTGSGDITLVGNVSADLLPTLALLTTGRVELRSGSFLATALQTNPAGRLLVTDGGLTISSGAALDSEIALSNASITALGDLTISKPLAFQSTSAVAAGGLLTLAGAVGAPPDALELTASDLELNGPITGGLVRIVSTAINVGGPLAGGRLNLSLPELAQVGTGQIVFGSSSTTQNVTVDGSYAGEVVQFAQPVLFETIPDGSTAFNTPVRVLAGGALAFAGGALELRSSISTRGVSLVFDVPVLLGSGPVTIDTTDGGAVSAPATITFTQLVDAETPADSSDLALISGTGTVTALLPIGSVTPLNSFSATGNTVTLSGVTARGSIFVGTFVTTWLGGVYSAGTTLNVTGATVNLPSDTTFAAGVSIDLPAVQGPYQLTLQGEAGSVTRLGDAVNVGSIRSTSLGDTIARNNLFTLGDMRFDGPLVAGSDGSYLFYAQSGTMRFSGPITWGDEGLSLSGSGDTEIGTASLGGLVISRGGEVRLTGNISTFGPFVADGTIIRLTAPTLTLTSSAGLVALDGDLDGGSTDLTITTDGQARLSGATLTLGSFTTTGAGSVEITATNGLDLTSSGGLVLGSTGTATLRGRIRTLAAGADLLVAGPAEIGGAQLESAGQLAIAAATVPAGTAAVLRSAGPMALGPVVGGGTLEVSGLDAASLILVNGGPVPGAFAVTAGLLSAIQLDPAGTLILGRDDQAGSIVFAGPTVLPGVNVIVRAPVAPAQIVIDAPLTVQPGGTLWFIGSGSTLVLNADLVTAGTPVQVNDRVLLGASVSIDTTGGGTVPGGASVVILGPVDAAADGLGLTVTTGGSSVQFLGAVGGATPLGSLLVQAGAIVVGGDVTTTGNQVYVGATMANGSWTLTASGFQASVIFGGTLDLAPGSVFSVVASEADFAGAVTGAGATLRILPFNLGQNIAVAGPEGAADLEVSQDELFFFEGVTTVQIGSVDGTGTLTVGDATLYSAETVFAMAGAGGAVGVNRIRPGTTSTSVTIRGSEATTTIYGSIVTRGGAVTIFDAVKLAGAVVVIDTTDGGASGGAPVFIAFAVNSLPGQGNGLNLEAGESSVELRGAVGGAEAGRPGLLLVNADGGIVLASPLLRTEGAQTYNGPVVLASDVVVQTEQAAVAFNGGVSGDYNLTIANGTGQTTVNGGVEFLASLLIEAGSTRRFGGEVNIGALTVTGGEVVFDGAALVNDGTLSGGTISGEGDVVINGVFTWTGGSFRGAGRVIVTPSGSLVIEGTGEKTMGRSLRVEGSVEATGGNVEFTGSEFVLEYSGVLVLAEHAGLTSATGTTLRIEGEVYREGEGASVLQGFSFQFTNDGYVGVFGGRLEVSDAFGTFGVAGVLEIGAGGRLRVIGDVSIADEALVVVSFASEEFGGRPLDAAPIAATGFATVNGYLGLWFVDDLPGLLSPVQIIGSAGRTGQFVEAFGFGLPTSQFFVQLGDEPGLWVSRWVSADFNGDGVLSLEDLDEYLAFYYSADEGDKDFNGDGFVNLDDVSDFIAQFYAQVELMPTMRPA